MVTGVPAVVAGVRLITAAILLVKHALAIGRSACLRSDCSCSKRSLACPCSGWSGAGGTSRRDDASGAVEEGLHKLGIGYGGADAKTVGTLSGVNSCPHSQTRTMAGEQ